MRGAACVGMLATVSGKMKVVQNSADGLTLVAERGLELLLLLTSGSRDFGNTSPFGAAASQQEGRPVFHDSYRFCFSARFARMRSRLIAILSRSGALAANSACKIALGNSIARLTPPRDVRTSTISY
jgi:hypothetical protein